MPRSIAIIFAAFAGVGFTAGLVAHTAAILGSPIALLGGHWWLLHFTGTVAIGAVFLASRRCKQILKPDYWPKWARVFYGSVFLYAVGSFLFITLSQTPEGRIERQTDGGWAILNGSRLVRRISVDEAQQLFVRKVRAQSGIWVLFHGASAIALLSCAAAARRQAHPPLQWTGQESP